MGIPEDQMLLGLVAPSLGFLNPSHSDFIEPTKAAMLDIAYLMKYGATVLLVSVFLSDMLLWEASLRERI